MCLVSSITYRRCAPPGGNLQLAIYFLSVIVGADRYTADDAMAIRPVRGVYCRRHTSNKRRSTFGLNLQITFWCQSFENNLKVNLIAQIYLYIYSAAAELLFPSPSHKKIVKQKLHWSCPSMRNNSATCSCARNSVHYQSYQTWSPQYKHLSTVIGRYQSYRTLSNPYQLLPDLIRTLSILLGLYQPYRNCCDDYTPLTLFRTLSIGVKPVSIAIRCT